MFFLSLDYHYERHIRYAYLKTYLKELLLMWKMLLSLPLLWCESITVYFMFACKNGTLPAWRLLMDLSVQAACLDLRYCWMVKKLQKVADNLSACIFVSLLMVNRNVSCRALACELASLSTLRLGC